MHERPESKWPGIGTALSSAVLFGLVAPLSKLLVGSVDAVLLAALLYVGAGAGAGTVWLTSYLSLRREREAGLRSRDLPWLAGAVLLGGVFAPVLLVFGLSETSAASGSLLLNLEGLATMAIAWIAFRENVDRRLLFGAALILIGASILSWRGSGLSFDRGGLLIAAACVCWAIDNNLTRNISAADPLQITAIKGTVAGLVNLALATALGAKAPAFTQVIATLALGAAGIGLSLVLFLRALRFLGVARTGAYYSVAPFIGAGFGLLLFAEPLSLQFVVAGILMGAGVWLHVSERHVHEHLHDAIEHEHVHVHDAHHRHSHDGPVVEPHSHVHRHDRLRHSHPHYPDLHHRHSH